MSENDHQTESCQETSCKDDLLQGLMALFAQADSAEDADDATSDKD